ncbi:MULTISPECIES: SDR family oxidoreductase [unclassified Pseudofrankia]|uniref:SDR family oxidoreductase n=1 Tax=unclassified Pseudofrankia TaxID=2994372 RepID=UPI0008D99C32|nr:MULTISPECIES: SDR family oxidoreductase [unclassified Pseudofrankia]MDT3446757.1 SDR family oxidoreductase [Pseudofrankia sp. BMG5.37]OHV59935.1 hypothetical protein BCD48_40995 [Pseudofrankia sp. BMG5.36]
MKSLVVLGARNLGGAIVDHFLATGWKATAIARSNDTLKAVEARGARALRADVTDSVQLRAALEEAGQIDCLVNAISVFPHPDPAMPWGGGPLSEATLDQYRLWAAANTEQAFVFFSEAARLLLAKQRPAAIVQVTGNAGRQVAPGMGAWSAGWHGVRALASTATHELRPSGIHVATLIVNGPIESPKTVPFLQNLPPEASVDPAEVAAAVAYLAGQGRRGQSHELTLTPAGQPPASW